MIVGLSGKAGVGKDTVADLLVEHHGFVKVALADPIKRAAMEWWSFTETQLWGPSEERNKPDERYPIGWWLPCGCLTDEKRVLETGGFWISNILEVCEEHKEVGDYWHRGRTLNSVLKRAFLTPRRALQKIGTEVGRAIDPNVWVRITMRAAADILEEGWHYKRTRGTYAGSKNSRIKGVVIPDCRFKNEFDSIQGEKGSLVRIYREGAGLKGSASKHASETEQQEVPDSYFDVVMNNAGSLHQLKLSVDSMMDRLTGKIIPFDEKQKDIPPFKRR